MTVWYVRYHNMFWLRPLIYSRMMQAIAFSWSSRLSEEFLNLISTHDPITALVVAHFAVLLTECRLAWWIAEWPLRIVLAAQKLLVATPELLVYLDWPLEIVKDNARER
jgi:hypothetical protein